MLSYDECKEIAVNRMKGSGIELNKAYAIPGGYVFENSEVEYTGVLPMVVSHKDGTIRGLWRYINDEDLTMDHMKDIDF